MPDRDIVVSKFPYVQARYVISRRDRAVGPMPPGAPFAEVLLTHENWFDTYLLLPGGLRVMIGTVRSLTVAIAEAEAIASRCSIAMESEGRPRGDQRRDVEIDGQELR